MVLTDKIKKGILLLISFAAALILCELYLRWNPPIGVYMATRNIVQLTHSELSPDLMLGYIPKAGIAKPFRNREFNVMVKINSMNLRDREYSLQKPEGIERIAVMGDSFVFGWGVENDEVFTEVLENQYLKNTEVLNFGVSGYAAFQELERLKNEGLRFHPDKVLFFLYGTPEGYVDYGAEQEEFQPTLKQKFVRFLEKVSYLFVLIQEARGYLQVSKFPPSDSAKFEEQVKKGWEVLAELKALGDQNHFVPMVVYIPTKDSAKIGKDPDASEVAEYCRERSLPFLDLTPMLHDSWIAKGKSPYFRIDDHWNREGHKIAAMALEQFLKGD